MVTVGQTTGLEEGNRISPSGRLLQDTGAQNKHGDLNRTPDQSPRGRETEKQRVLGFGGFQGASVNRL